MGITNAAVAWPTPVAVTYARSAVKRSRRCQQIATQTYRSHTIHTSPIKTKRTTRGARGAGDRIPAEAIDLRGSDSGEFARGIYFKAGSSSSLQNITDIVGKSLRASTLEPITIRSH